MIPLSHPIIGDAELEAVRRVLVSGHVASGPEVEAFEAEFAAAVEANHAVAVSSGTMAIHLGLWALGIGPGDEVIVPSFTFEATANSVRLVGALPVFADIDPATFTITATTVEPLLSERTVAVMPVHLYGQPAPMAELTALCDARGLALVEDAAQAHGASYRGRRVGSIGAFAAFSFYPTKNMTTGEGGMVTTNDPAVAEQLRLLRNHGMRVRYHHEIVGLNGRMTDIAAAIGRVQLTRLAEWNKQRRHNAATYDDLLRDSVETPRASADGTHVYHQYTIRTPDRSTLTGRLDAAGIGYGIYYPVPGHLQPAGGGRPGTLPETESAAAEVLSIPVRPDLTSAELERVAAVIAGGGA